jgi:dienelactone hydrolase
MPTRPCRKRRPTAVGVALLVAAALPVPGELTAQGEPRPDSIRAVALPEPWGEHEVGVLSMVVEDSSRTVAPGGVARPRPVLVRLWYPASASGTPPRPYMDALTADAWRGTLPVPRGFERAVTAHGVDDAPWAGPAPVEGWPLLLFSHGRSFPVENYQIVLEQLASQGWVVAALSHVGEEALTLLPDGATFPFDGPTWDTPEERGSVLMRVVDELVRDARVVLDALEAANAAPGHVLAGRLALASGVGYYGHSLGGAAAAWTLQRDPRVRAAASWEGQVYRDADRPMVVAGPLMYLIGGANRAELSWRHFRSGGPGAPVYEVVIDGAWHASMGELLHIYRAYGPRDWQVRHRREITAERANQISADMLDAFFGAHLLGRSSDLLRPDSEEERGSAATWNYPEVDLSVSVAPPPARAGGGR